MKRILFAPYKPGSAGCKALATAIGAQRTSGFKRFKRDVIAVNWGRSNLIIRGNPALVLNPAHNVARATNKLDCLNRLQECGVSKIKHTTNSNVVRQWLNDTEAVVYGRQLLNASQGKGIVLIKSGDEIPNCPLYTKGIIKSHEYRVHIFQGQVLDVAKKRRRNGVDTNDYIKNVSNGWVFCRDNVEIPDGLIQCAIDAVEALKLDFGAVDLLYRKDIPYVLEINTAPGLQGTTLQKYIERFNMLKEML